MVGLLATVVYLLTMDRSVSWWDCGEFIATSWTLGVGHPPGAPIYQLICHVVLLLGMGHVAWIAPLSNAVSALCAGATVGILHASLLELRASQLGAMVGALCYGLCDAVWFSAIESEVYAMAMLVCAVQFHLALRYRHQHDVRLLLLMALLCGLGVGVHLMTLLVLPGCLPLVWSKVKQPRRIAVGIALFMCIGLSPYAIIPLRAAANPAINEIGDKGLGGYLRREQYAKAPLYPRMWRERDAKHWHYWSLGKEGVVGNVLYYVRYQLGYMYGRYLWQAYGSRSNFKHGYQVFFLLPLMLGIVGVISTWKPKNRSDRREKESVWLLFLFGGVLLNLYLNHPCYEPRERDYVYVLSFYAFALWIGLGVSAVQRWGFLRRPAIPSMVIIIVLLLAPVLLGIGNWSDHDRSRCHSVHDIALNHLESCDADAILITLGDNDTFPLFYLQQVEHRREDVSVYNIGLTGWLHTMNLIENNAWERPVYVTNFFQQQYGYLFAGRLRCEGFCYRLLPTSDGVADYEPLQRHLNEGIRWHIDRHEYIDAVSQSFLCDWEELVGSAPLDAHILVEPI